jgi:hypothetical protein
MKVRSGLVMNDPKSYTWYSATSSFVNYRARNALALFHEVGEKNIGLTTCASTRNRSSVFLLSITDYIEFSKKKLLFVLLKSSEAVPYETKPYNI